LIELDLFFEDGTRRHGSFEVPLVMGRAPECSIQVSHWRVARQHLRISRAEDGFHVDDLGSILGTRVNGNRISRYGPLKKADEVVVGPCLLRLASRTLPITAIKSVCSEGNAAELGRLASRLETKTLALDSSYFSGNESASVIANVTASPNTQSLQRSANISSDSSTFSQFDTKVLKAERWWHTHDNATAAVRQGLLAEPSASQPVQQPGVAKQAPTQESVVAQQEPTQHSSVIQQELSRQSVIAQQALDQQFVVAQQELRHELRAGLIQAFDLRRNDVGALSERALKAQAQACVAELLDKRKLALTKWQREKILKLVVDEAIGLGVLEDLLEDAAITEIMVNRFDDIYVESHGKLLRHALQFSSEQAVRSVIERIVYPLGRRIDEASPMVDARLPDGSRVNAVLPPIAVNGANFTIRKFPKKRLQMQDLVSLQALPAPLAGFLRLCVERRLNILVSGGTGSGKTTLLNVLAGFVDPDQRIVTIEDCAELLIVHPHVVTLEARQANSEGQGAITIRDLVKNALRMRPDRIVIGEVRSAEAIDMLAAMNTGHDGSITTLHANSPRDALSRLETMVLSGNAGLPLQAIREQIGSALHLVVQQTRLANGRRVITGVAEIVGMESGTIQTQQLASFDAAHQRLRGAGLRPTIFEQATDHPDPAIVNWFLHT
jgi:pilus assembly protein CpaF